jgi:hypothetical protein
MATNIAINFFDATNFYYYTEEHQEGNTELHGEKLVGNDWMVSGS